MIVRVVEDMDEAIRYIEQYGSQHTEVIVTESYSDSQRFLREVDASRRDDQCFQPLQRRWPVWSWRGDRGISTTKLHAYGPMGLKELTTRKFVVYGEGEIRQ